jgi:GNAT superfamily N-acetyltransferase
LSHNFTWIFGNPVLVFKKKATEKMNLKNNILLRPAEPEHDFGQLAALFSNEQDEPTTESELKKEYETERERIILKVAEDKQGELLGFYWTYHSKLEAGRVHLYLIVKPEYRKQGVGSQLYEDMEQVLKEAHPRKIRVSVRDTCPECRAFTEQRGFSETSHQFAMELDLDTFDDRYYDPMIARLEAEGFQFTSMEALGNTPEAQRKLYHLNASNSMDIPGSGGERSWTSFEDFQNSVCLADWYKPGGQKVVIDSATGAWAGMSAITRKEGSDYAYNLHTGVDRPYRGRKLAQAVRVTALRYAREVLQVHTVRTHHNSLNQPMIAISRKFGYAFLPGTYTMEKLL